MEPNVLILGWPKSYRLSMTTFIDGVRIGGNSHDVISGVICDAATNTFSAGDPTR